MFIITFHILSLRVNNVANFETYICHQINRYKDKCPVDLHVAQLSSTCTSAIDPVESVKDPIAYILTFSFILKYRDFPATKIVEIP